MAKFTLDEILENDPLGLLGEVKAKNPVLTADDRLVASFEEINLFVEQKGHEPSKLLDMNERKLYTRLEGIREDVNKSESLKKHDRFNLLKLSELEALSPNKTRLKPSLPESIDNILNDDILGLLSDDAEDIFTLKNVPKVEKNRADADFVARREHCKNFDKYETKFKKCQAELKEEKRELIDSIESRLEVGTFCILDGVLLYIAKIEQGKRGNSNKINRRTLLIFENGTQSNMLLRSLGKRLKENGKMLSETNDSVLNNLNQLTEDDQESGYIYILKSLSSDDRIATKKNLYKIGFSKDDVRDRIKNAKNEPTYLMADVSIVDVYQCFNMNSQKLEQLLHKFFGKVCLNIEIFDTEGKGYFPREWFVASLDVIDEAVGLIVSGKIVDYRYDYEEERIKYV